MNVTYIKKNTPNKYITFSRLLDSTLYDNIGNTWDDYLNNKWVKLSRAQIQFHTENPEASVNEVFNMKIEKTTENISDIKNKKIESLLNYDKSNYINMFFINDKPDWWDKNKRLSIYHRLEVEKKSNKSVTTLWFNNAGLKFDLDLKKAADMLLQLENYAIACYDNTNTHLFNIKQLNTIEEIENYDFLQGYPDKIKFVI